MLIFKYIIFVCNTQIMQFLAYTGTGMHGTHMNVARVTVTGFIVVTKIHVMRTCFSFVFVCVNIK